MTDVNGIPLQRDGITPATDPSQYVWSGASTSHGAYALNAGVLWLNVDPATGTPTGASGIIHTFGTSSDGLRAEGAGSQVTATNENVTTDGDNSFGAQALGGGTISVTGGSITTNGYRSDILRADGAGSGITATNVTLVANGLLPNGASAVNGAAITLAGGTLDAFGPTTFDLGLSASGAGTSITASQGLVINFSGIGAIADSGATISLDHVSINQHLASDLSQAGAGVTSAASMVLTDSSITTSGPGAYGIFVDGADSLATVLRTPVTSGQFDVGTVADGGTLLITNSALRGGLDGVVFFRGTSDQPNTAVVDGGSLTSARAMPSVSTAPSRTSSPATERRFSAGSGNILSVSSASGTDSSPPSCRCRGFHGAKYRRHRQHHFGCRQHGRNSPPLEYDYHRYRREYGHRYRRQQHLGNERLVEHPFADARGQGAVHRAGRRCDPVRELQDADG